MYATIDAEGYVRLAALIGGLSFVLAFLIGRYGAGTRALSLLSGLLLCPPVIGSSIALYATAEDWLNDASMLALALAIGNLAYFLGYLIIWACTLGGFGCGRVLRGIPYP